MSRISLFAAQASEHFGLNSNIIVTIRSAWPLCHDISFRWIPPSEIPDWLPEEGAGKN